MKKKLKELSKKDIEKICQLQPNCNKCPLNAKHINCYLMYSVSKEYWDNQQDKEIEL